MSDLQQWMINKLDNWLLLFNDAISTAEIMYNVMGKCNKWWVGKPWKTQSETGC
jgi:hypothetical protein